MNLVDGVHVCGDECDCMPDPEPQPPVQQFDPEDPYCWFYEDDPE